jgi:peptide/nickel transport system ATP-binding protein
LLLDLQEELNLTYIFISHDLGVIKFISDEVAVMYNGKVVEMADSESIYKNPQHDYTKKLLSAIPKGLPKALRS